jgi:hypothetical protein
MIGGGRQALQAHGAGDFHVFPVVDLAFGGDVAHLLDDHQAQAGGQLAVMRLPGEGSTGVDDACAAEGGCLP